MYAHPSEALRLAAFHRQQQPQPQKVTAINSYTDTLRTNNKGAQNIERLTC